MKPKGFFITGTDTGVGKTVITACLVSLFKKYQLDVGVMKPFETGVDPECSSAANSDALFLMEVAGCGDSLSDVSPVRLKSAASPYQSANRENRGIEIDSVRESFAKLSGKHDCLLVEGIGGIEVPLTRSYRVVDLIRDLGLPAIVVGRNTVGTINHTLMTLNAARQKGIKVCGVVLNRLEPGEPTEIEKGQAGIIEELSGVPILGECPFLGTISSDGFGSPGISEFEGNLNLDLLGIGALRQ